MADMTVAEIRALITKHKRWDLIFATIGVLALMVGVLTFASLFAGWRSTVHIVFRWVSSPISRRVIPNRPASCRPGSVPRW